MKKLVVVLLVAVMSLSLAPQSKAADLIPAECFVNYAVWAGPYCTTYIICFVFHSCSTTPGPELNGPASDGLSPLYKTKWKIEEAPSDADGLSG